MGNRGPVRQPTALQDFAGNPSHRTKNNFEPKPPTVSTQPPPDWLRPRSKQFWIELVPMLANVGLLTVADLSLLERYCDFLLDFHDCCDFLRKANNLFYPIYEREKDGKIKLGEPEAGSPEGTKGKPLIKYLMQYPQVAQKIRLSEHLLKIEMHFGMTPAARSRIMVDGSGQQQPLGSANAGAYGSDPFGSNGSEDDGSGRLVEQ